jgi:hypothetical protein
VNILPKFGHFKFPRIIHVTFITVEQIVSLKGSEDVDSLL